MQYQTTSTSKPAPVTQVELAKDTILHTVFMTIAPSVGTIMYLKED